MARRDRQESLARDNAAAAAVSRRDRDIGPRYPSGPDDPARRNACEHDLHRFLICYFHNAFRLEFSQDHRRVIARMQECILSGGLFACNLPRGGGKTALATRAGLWGLLYGHRKFICLIGASERRATDMLKTIKTELTRMAFP